MGMDLDEMKKFYRELSKKSSTLNRKSFISRIVDRYRANLENFGEKVSIEEETKIRKEAENEFDKIQKDLSKIRQIISKDFDNSFMSYMEYLLLHRHLEKQGSKFYAYIRILEKTKNVDKCLNSIGLDHIKKLKISDLEFIRIESDVESSHTYGYGLNWLSVQNNTGDLAVEQLIDKINARAAELEKEEKQFDAKTKKRLMEIINKGRFIDATVELEKVFEASKQIPEQSFLECINAYVNLGGPLGCESLQRELRDMTARISKENNGEIYVDLHADTYRQIRNIIKQIHEKFKDNALRSDITVYRGINREGFLKLLRANGINIKEEDFTLDNVSSKIKGKTFIDKAFMSTSKDKKIAEEFAKMNSYEIEQKADEQDVLGAIFEIELKKGTQMIDINEDLQTKRFEREKEILLPNNTKLRVNSTENYEFEVYNYETWNDESRHLLWIKTSLVK